MSSTWPDSPGPSEFKISPKSSQRLSLLDLDNRLAVEKGHKRRRHPVSTEDGFDPDHPLPLFLSDHAREPEERGLLLLLNAIILLITAILVGIAITLSLGNPVAVFGDIKASLTGNSALQPQPVQSTPTIQSTAEAQALPSAARGGRDEIATATDTADQ